MFCMNCGNRIVQNGSANPVVAPNVFITDKKAKSKPGKGGIFAFILGVLSFVGFVLMLITVGEFIGDNDVFMIVTCAIAVVAIAGLILFIASKKSKLSIVGGVLSSIVLVALMVFVFFFIPQAEKSITKSIIQELEHSEHSSDYIKVNAYPYGSIYSFYLDSNNRKEIQTHLIDLYEDGDYSSFVAQSSVLNNTVGGNVYNGSNFIAELFDAGYDVSAYELKSYDVLFSSSPIYDSYETAATKVKTAINSEITAIDNGESVRMSTGVVYRICNGLLIARYNPGMGSYLVVDLGNGKFFYEGNDWY